MTQPGGRSSKQMLSAGWDALTTARPLRGRELALAWGLLALLCALTFGPHVLDGGFYLDDWSNGATSLEPAGGDSIGNTLSAFADQTLFRPVLVLYVPTTYWLFEMNMTVHLAWAISITLLIAWFLYGILRTLGVPAIHAWIVSGLTLVYPWSDSTKLWVTGDQVALGVAFACAGLWVALVGLNRRSWWWHAGAAALYLVSMLTYEVALPLVACLGAIYVLRVGWRQGRARWAVDLAMVAIAGIWVGTQTAREKSGLAENVEHLKQIVEGGGELVGRTLIPVGPEQMALGIAILFGVSLLGAAAYFGLPRRFAGSGGWGLREWLLMTAGGLCVMVLGWTIFIPADPYYTPIVYGVTNRVNGLAAVGLVIAAYGVFGIAGSLLGGLLNRPRAGALAVVLVLSAALGMSYVHVIRRHTQIWDTAYMIEQKGINELRAQYPRLPEWSTLYVSGYPSNQTLGVPIFSSTWDVDGMIKTEYDDWTLSAFPVIAGTRLACTPTGVQMVAEETGEVMVPPAPYGRVRLFDFGPGPKAAPANRRECQAVIGKYLPGPLYLSSDY